MIEHQEIRLMDEAFTKLIQTKPWLNGTRKPRNVGDRNHFTDSVTKVRSRFRKKVRTSADRNRPFSSCSNGAGTFEAWKNGFELARDLANVEVHYIFFEGSNSASFFWTEFAAQKLENVLEAFTKELQQLEHLETVSEVMTS